MSTSKNIFIGMIGAFLLDGVEINKVDTSTGTWYITVPNKSEIYDENRGKNGAVVSADTMASSIKRMMKDICGMDCNVKYRVRDIRWTRDMGRENYNRNIGKVRAMLQNRD